MKKIILSLLQVIIGIALLAFIFTHIKNPEDLRDGLDTALSHWPLLVIGIFCFAICISLTVFRWKLLLEAQGLKPTIWKAHALTYIGLFFSLFLLGSTGGDLLKAVYITIEAPSKKAEAITTIIVDRLIGLIAIMFLCALAMIAKFNFFMSQPKTKGIFAFDVCIILGVAGIFFLAFYQNIFEKWPLFKKLEQKSGFGNILKKIYDSFRVCLKDRTILFKALALSMGNHLVIVICAFFIGMSLEIELSIIDYFLFFPVINMIAAVPVSPGGLGVREGAAVLLLGSAGVSESNALLLSLLVWFCTLFIWGSFGGIIYFFYIFRKNESGMEA